MRFDLTTLLIGLMKEDTDMIVKAIYRLAAVPAETFSGTLGNMPGKIEKIVDQLLIGEIKVGMKHVYTDYI
ncbi:hypothetical protein M3182_01115 [Mesobacillus maritimus]|uniref:hypothetical protein n=1 Tax=Mesobacillus maritimus TaxID=1643336 RepID=UPI00203A5DF4|nr:hypothetical protein [Mesobacillus maritimus]MCM3584339.1 hypothetical protein [Mesobacillus maritimus]